MNAAQKIRNEALSLSASERAGLAHDLILSLDSPSDFDLGPGTEREISRRIQSIRRGKAVGRSAEDVISDIKAEYK